TPRRRTKRAASFHREGRGARGHEARVKSSSGTNAARGDGDRAVDRGRGGRVVAVVEAAREADRPVADVLDVAARDPHRRRADEAELTRVLFLLDGEHA